jgi:hypothetical protein
MEEKTRFPSDVSFDAPRLNYTEPQASLSRTGPLCSMGSGLNNETAWEMSRDRTDAASTAAQKSKGRYLA